MTTAISSTATQTSIGAGGNTSALVIDTNGIYTAAINGGQLGGFRNRIINGDMRIDQRNAGAATTPASSAYGVDRWKNIITQASKITTQMVVDAPPGLYTSTKVSVAASYVPVASDYFGLVQTIEASNFTDFQQGLTTAQAFTMSFWVKGSVPGTYSVSIRGASFTRCYMFTYTVTTNWSQVKVAIPGDVAGSWIAGGTGAGVEIWFDLGSGATYRGSPNSWQAVNLVGTTGSTNFVSQANASTINFTGVQLELGSIATPFEQRSIGTELMLCQRYFERLEYMRWDLYAGGTGSDMYLSLPLKVTKRGAPSITPSSVTTTFSGVSYAASNIGFVNIQSTGTVAGDNYYFWAYCDANAEL